MNAPDFRAQPTASARRRMPSLLAGGRARRLGWIVLLACGQAIAAGVAAFATREVFAQLREPAQAFPWTPLVLIGAAGLALALLRWAEHVAAEGLGQDYAAAMRLRIYRHVARMHHRDLQARRSGALALRFVGDLTAVRRWVSLGVARVVSASIVLPAATLVLFLLHPALAAVAVWPLMAALVLMALTGRGLGVAHHRLRRRRGRLATDMSERVAQAPALRLLGRTGTETRRLMDHNAALRQAALARVRRASLVRVIPDAAAGLAAAAVLGAAWWWAVPAAEVAAALAALGLMVQPMRDLAAAWDLHAAWTAARVRCEELLGTPVLRTPKRDVSPAAVGPPAVRLSSVAVAGLEGVDATVAPGQSVAIVGPNGAGKSTLLRLIAGLDVPRSGQVWVGGHAPTELASAQRRRTIGHIDARTPVLAGSLRRALTLGMRRRPQDAQVLAQAMRHGLGPVLDRLGGLDGAVREGGRNLSSGEIQRLHLARLALAAPGLLLLDEPEGALDTEGVGLVAALIAGAGATTLLVTNRLPLARQMDLMWYVDRGRLLEVGRPDELLRGDGPAARHFRLRPAA